MPQLIISRDKPQNSSAKCTRYRIDTTEASEFMKSNTMNHNTFNFPTFSDATTPVLLSQMVVKCDIFELIFNVFLR